MAEPKQTLSLVEREERLKADELDTPAYSATVASRDDKVDSILSELVNRKRRTRPVPITQNSGKTTAAGPLTYNFLDLGGPPNANRIWDVLRYAVWGIDPFTAVTGSVFPFIAAGPPNDSNTEPLFSNVVDVSVTLANVATWSGHQLVLHFGEHLILAFKGVPANTALYAVLQAEEEDRNEFRVDRD